MEVLVLLIVVVVFDLVAFHWGFDSTDGINSLEWMRRQLWYGFH